MDWGEYLMDIGVATIIAAIGISLLADFKGWRKVQEKIGKNKTSSLEEQHENLEKTVINKTENMKELQNVEFNKIYTIVDKTNDIIVKNENEYQNLNVNQKEIKNNIDKLLREWQTLVTENKELKKELDIIKEQNRKLSRQIEMLNEDGWDLGM